MLYIQKTYFKELPGHPVLRVRVQYSLGVDHRPGSVKYVLWLKE